MLDLRWHGVFNALSCSLYPVPMNADSIRSLLKTKAKPHGIVFSGGNNVSALEPSPENRLRDECEILLLEYAIANDVPVLGICRGMQFVASRSNLPPIKLANHAGTRHAIRFSMNDLKPELAKEIETNSYHDYGFKSVPAEFETLAECPSDQTIEAIRHKKHRVAAVMWHPEREPTLTEHDRFLISKFLRLSPET